MTRLHGLGYAAVMLGSVLLFGCGSNAKPPHSDSKPQPPPPASAPKESPASAAAKEKSPLVEPKSREAVATDGPREQIRQSLRELSLDNAEVRALATERIASVDQASEKVLSFMKDQDAEVRRGAAFFLLDRFDVANNEMTATFEEALEDEDKMVRRLALQVVQRFPKERLVGAVARLGALLENPAEDAVNRTALARRIAKLERDGKDALPYLVRVAKSDAEKNVKNACIFAISQVVEPSEAIGPLLDIVATEKNPEVKYVAVARLGRIGPEAQPAVAPLCRQFKDPNQKLRRGAAEALGRIGEPSVGPLIELLSSKDAVERRLSVYALGKIGSPAKRAIPALAKLADDPDEEVRKLAAAVFRLLQTEP